MSYFYEIGYGSHEDSGSIQLVHDREFTIQQWDGMVFRASVETAKRHWQEQKDRFRMEREDEYLGYAAEDEAAGNHDMAQKWRDYLAADRYADARLSMDSMYRDLANVMVEMYGFTLLQYTHTRYFDGWDNLAETRGFGGHRSRYQESLSKMVRDTIVHDRALTEEELKLRNELEIEAQNRWERDNPRPQRDSANDLDYLCPIDEELLKAFGADLQKEE